MPSKRGSRSRPSITLHEAGCGINLTSQQIQQSATLSLGHLFVLRCWLGFAVLLESGVCFCKARKHCVLCTALCSHFLLPLPFFQCLRAGSAPWLPIPLSHPCQGRRQTHWCSRTATLLRLFLLRDVVPRCGMEHVSLCFVT